MSNSSWKVLFSFTTLAVAGTLLFPIQPAVAAGKLHRVYGPNRIGTAIEVSKQLFPNPDSAGAVIVTRHDAFPDALAASSLAGISRAPILLNTPSGGLDPVVRGEIDRVLPDGGTVFVIGGTAAISDQVIAELQSSYSVERIAGANRYETAVRIKERGDTARGNSVAAAFFARGDTYPDALSVSSYASFSGTPILLIESQSIPDVVLPLVTSNLASPYILGGTSAVSDQVLQQIESTTGSPAVRISGVDRYATSAAIAEYFYPAPLAVTFATGQNFPDALAGGVLAGLSILSPSGLPMLLVQRESVPGAIGNYIAAHAGTIDDVTSGYILGGESAISLDLEFALEAAL